MNFGEWVSAMPVREVLDVALSYVKVLLSWPSVTLIALLVFRRRIAQLIERIKSIAPTKVSFYDLKATAEKARAADEDATSRLQEDAATTLREASPSDSDSDTADPDTEAQSTQSPTAEAGSEPTDTSKLWLHPTAGSKRAEQRRLREHLVDFLDDDEAAVRLPSRGGKQSKASVALVNDSWHQLEITCREVARTLGADALKSGSTILRPSWGPVELFTELYLQGFGTIEGVEAAHKARGLRADLNAGAAIDEDEAVALASAIEALGSTVKKLAAIRKGKQFVESWLERHGHETLPETDSPG